MSKSDKRLNLYVAVAFKGSGTEAYAGWVRENGSPDRLPSGSKRLQNIGKRYAERVAAVLAVNAALRDVEGGSRLLLHSADQEVCDLINSEGVVQFVRDAMREQKPKHLIQAAQSLTVELGRHHDVRAQHVINNPQQAQSASLVNMAFEIANGKKSNVDAHKQKKRKGRRKMNDDRAIAASLNLDE